LKASLAPGGGAAKRTLGGAARGMGSVLKAALTAATQSSPAKRSLGSAYLAVKKQIVSDGEEEEAPAPRRTLVMRPRASLTARHKSGDAAPPRSGKPRLTARLTGHKPAGDAPGRRLLGTVMGHLSGARRPVIDLERTPRRKGNLVAAGAVKRLLAPAAGRLRPRAKEEPKETAEEAEERELTELQHRLEGHYTNMKNFIRTRAEPTVFYLPAQHNAKTERSLRETRAAIEQKIKSLKVHLREPPEDREPEESDEESGSEDGESDDE